MLSYANTINLKHGKISEKAIQTSLKFINYCVFIDLQKNI